MYPYQKHLSIIEDINFKLKEYFTKIRLPLASIYYLRPNEGIFTDKMQTQIESTLSDHRIPFDSIIRWKKDHLSIEP